MDLYVLRHGVAEELGGTATTDRDRKLTDDGIAKLRAANKGLQRLDVKCDLILSSPYPRAYQTAEIAAAGIGCTETIETTDCLAPGSNCEKVISDLKKRKAKRVMVVGHNPLQSELIGAIVCGDPDAGFDLKKGGLAKISFGSGVGILEWLVTGKLLRQLGGAE